MASIYVIGPSPKLDAGWAPDGGIFDAPFVMAAEDAAALETAGYMANGYWLVAGPAEFAVLAGVVFCLAIPDGISIPVFY